MRLFVLPASSALAILIAVVGYACSSSRSDDARDGAMQSTTRSPVRDARAVDRIDDHPVDADGWQSLGRVYAAQGKSVV